MQKIIITFLVILFSFCSLVYADVVTVQVTEKIPGAECTCIANGAQDTPAGDGMGPPKPGTGEAACGDINTRKYECKVEKGLGSFQSLIATIVRWFVNIVTLLGVLAIVGAGVMMMFGSDSEEYTKKAKGWAKNIIIGLVILFTFRYILQFLAPWIFQ